MNSVIDKLTEKGEFAIGILNKDLKFRDSDDGG